MNPYQITFEKLEHFLGTALYCATPKLFIIKGIQPDECRYRHHCYFYSEKKYGKAVTISRICKNCGLGIGEAFPRGKSNLPNCILSTETGEVL